MLAASLNVCATPDKPGPLAAPVSTTVYDVVGGYAFGPDNRTVRTAKPVNLCCTPFRR